MSGLNLDALWSKVQTTSGRAKPTDAQRRGWWAELRGATPPAMHVLSLRAGRCRAAGGCIGLSIPLLLLEIRRIQLADYLPALVIAPAAVWTFF